MTEMKNRNSTCRITTEEGEPLDVKEFLQSDETLISELSCTIPTGKFILSETSCWLGLTDRRIIMLRDPALYKKRSLCSRPLEDVRRIRSITEQGLSPADNPILSITFRNENPDSEGEISLYVMSEAGKIDEFVSSFNRRDYRSAYS